MKASELESVLKTAITMARETTLEIRGENNSEFVSRISAALITGALRNKEVRTALLAWKPKK